MRKPVIGSIIVAISVLILQKPATAGTIGYWRFEDAGATAVVPITTTSSAVNSPTLDGTNSGTPRYSSDVPGMQIYDPVTGRGYINSFSMDAGGSNAQVSVGNDPLLNVDNGGDKSFTIEFFMRLDGQPASYESFARRYFSGPNPDGSTGTDNRFWQIDFDHGSTGTSFGKIRSRWDTPGSGVPRVDWDYNNVTGGSYVFLDTESGSGNPGDYGSPDVALEGDGINDDTDWHHLALVFNDQTDQFRIFTDGTPGSLRTLAGEFEHPDASLIFGKLTGGTYGLLFDEVRYSSGALTPDQFLQAQTPEPSTLILLVTGAGCAAAVRRRRRRR